MQDEALNLIQKFFPKVVTFKRRSPQWDKVRKEYLKAHPDCECCGTKKKIEVHHIRPYHEYPELELKKENMISLCDDRCHLVLGHLGNYKSFNITVRADAEYLRRKIELRPE